VSDTPKPSIKDCTEYVVLRRFPFARALQFPPSLNSGRNRLPGPTPEDRQAVAVYRAELAALSEDELFARYKAEKQRKYDQLIAKAEQDERKHFFNQPHAAADFVHWSKMAHWTLDEAIALSFGKAPELVHWRDVSKYLQLSRFAGQYQRRRELATRAVQWKQLYDPVLPGIFLAWAERTDISVPRELTEAVEKRGVQVADWKTLHDKAVEARKQDAEAAEKQLAEWKQLLDKNTAQLGKQGADWVEIVNAKKVKIAALEAKIDALQSLQSPAEAEQGIGARERDSLLKLVIGMAVSGYAYDPKAARSDRPTEIAGDLERAGVPLDVDTVRKWLREAADLLPPKANN
jgi:hypothetical protein